MKITWSDIEEAKNWKKLITHWAVRELEDRVIEHAHREWGDDSFIILSHFTSIEFDDEFNIIDEDGSIDLNELDKNYLPIYVFTKRNKMLRPSWIDLNDILDKE